MDKVNEWSGMENGQHRIKMYWNEREKMKMKRKRDESRRSAYAHLEFN